LRREAALALVLTGAIWTGPLSLAGILNYAGKVTLDPASAEIAELLTIGLAAPADGADQLELNLNKDLAVSALSCARCFSYREGPVNEGSNIRPVVVTFRPKLRPNERADIRIEAHGQTHSRLQ
jgi:hypothetical protein